MLLLDAWTRLDHGLTTLEPLWRVQPFRLVTAAPSSVAGTDTWQHHPLHKKALELDERTFRELSAGTDSSDLRLQEWMLDALVDLTNDDDDDSGSAQQSFREMTDVLEQIPTQPNTNQQHQQQQQPPSYAGRTLPREASGVPGRKWEQVEAFASLVPKGKRPIVDWCSGKGHLARWMHTTGCSCGCPVHCLEMDATLCRSGRLLTEKKKQATIPVPDGLCLRGSSLTFYEHDVLKDRLPFHLRGANCTYTALHACGELHRTVLVSAVNEHAKALVIVPCCYEKHFGCGGAGVVRGTLAASDTGTFFQPLSAVAHQRTSLSSLTQEDLCLATADGVVTATAKEAKVREREQAWRLGFDLWRRDQEDEEELLELSLDAMPSSGGGNDADTLSSSVLPNVLTVPSAPYRLIAEDDFVLFLKHCVSSPGRNSMARQRFEPVLEKALSNDRRTLEEYAKRGEALRLQVERLELVRRAFQRPFEMWLLTDYGLFLQENGYEVELQQLCHRSITPRNIAIVAQRRL